MSDPGCTGPAWVSVNDQGRAREETPNGPVSPEWVARCGSSGTDWLLPQNGELTMLGEITHLQGIIDDLVVLTAEPHKLPPASEQVRPALESRAKTRTREEMVLPWCGDRR